MNVEEKARFGRAFFLVLNTCPVALRRVIEHYFTTNGFSGFDTFLDQQNNKHLLFHLRFQKCCLVHCTSRSIHATLRAQQWDLLYKETSTRNPHGDRGKCPCMYTAIPGITTEAMDVTLCCVLLRNICPGINNSNIETIRTVRNQLLHAGSATLDEQSFKDAWIKTETAILSLASTISVSFHKEMVTSVQETRSGFCDLTNLDSLLTIERRLESLEETQERETQKNEEYEKRMHSLEEENVKTKFRLGEIESEKSNTSSKVEKIEMDNISTKERMSKLETDDVNKLKRIKSLELSNFCTNQKVRKNQTEKSAMNQRITSMETESTHTKQRVTTLEMNEADKKQRVVTLEMNEADTKQRVTTLEMNEADTKQRVVTLEMNEADTKQRVVTLEMNEADTKHRMDNIERSIADRYQKSHSKTESDETEKEDERKDKVLKALLTINSRFSEKIQISPLQETYKDFDQIYGSPVILKDEDEDEDEMSNRKRISCPRDMFYKKGEHVRYIFLEGEAGHGKTVYCQQLVRHWCRAKGAGKNKGKEGMSDWERALDEFEFVFMIMLRHVQKSRTSLLDMICHDLFRHFASHGADIRYVLGSDKYHCLIIIDGLDEWKITDEIRKALVHKALPNIDGTSCCTFLFTYRPWKHAEIAGEIKSCDRVIQIHGFDEKGKETVIENILETLYKKNSNRKAIETKRNEIIEKSKRLNFTSILEIPLLVTAFVVLYHQDEFNESSMTGFYVALVQLLIKRAINKESLYQSIMSKCSNSITEGSNDQNEYFPDILASDRNKTFRQYLPVLTELGKIAYFDLMSTETRLVFSKEELEGKLGKENLEFALYVGLLSRCEAIGSFDQENVSVNFFHKTIQEFLAAAHIVCRGEVGIQSFFDQLPSVKVILECSNVVSFVSGLSPPFGCSISSHISQVSNQEEYVMKTSMRYKIDAKFLFELQCKCYKEIIYNHVDRNVPLQKSSLSKQEDTKQRNEMQNISFHLAYIYIGPGSFFPTKEALNMIQDPRVDTVGLSVNSTKRLEVKKKVICTEALTKFFLRTKSLQYLRVQFAQLEGIGECLSLRLVILEKITFSKKFMHGLVMSIKSSRQLKTLKLSNIELINTGEKYAREEESDYPPKSKTEKPVKPLLFIPPLASNQDIEFESLEGLLLTLKDCPNLSTLHIDYKSLESTASKDALLEVLPCLMDLVDLKVNGYNIWEDPDETFDTAVLEKISQLPQLQYLHLNHIYLNERFTDVISNRSSVRRLILEDLKIQDGSMYHISQMSQLQYLQMMCIEISDADRDIKFKLPLLQELRLSGLYGENVSVELKSECKEIKKVDFEAVNMSENSCRNFVTYVQKLDHKVHVFLTDRVINAESLRMIDRCSQIKLVIKNRSHP